MRRSDGYILFVSLIFIQLLSLLGLSGTTELMLFRKSMTYVVRKIEIENQFATISKKFSSSSFKWNGLLCMSAVMPSYLIKKLSYHWWVEHACHDQNIYYIVEYLGSNNCAYDANTVNDQFFTVNYYRVTLAYFHQENFAFFQQSTYAEPAQMNLTCVGGKKHFVVLGRQMIRNI